MIDLKKLKIYRMNKGLTQTDLAEKAGISLSHYSQIERGEHGASVETLEGILDVLSITIYDLDDAKKPPATPEQITVERSDGSARVKYVFPFTPETCERLLKEVAVGGANVILDPRLQAVNDKWQTLGEEKKAAIFRLLDDNQ